MLEGDFLIISRIIIISLAELTEAFALALSLAFDTFAMGLAYGGNKIKIPFVSVVIINIICCLFTGISFILGNIIKRYIPQSQYRSTAIICFSFLIIMGVIKLLDSFTKAIIRKYKNLNKKIKFSFFNLKFILNLYADPEKADIDLSKTLSPKESVALGVSVSLDGLAVGFGAAIGNVNGLAVVLFSIITNSVAVILGCYIGNKIAKKLSFNLSWLSGVILIALAFSKLL